MGHQSKQVPGHFLFLHALQEAVRGALLSPSLTKESFDALYTQFKTAFAHKSQEQERSEIARLLKSKDLELCIDTLVDLSTSHSKKEFLGEKALVKAIVPKIYQILQQEALSTENRALLNIAIKKMGLLYAKAPAKMSSQPTNAIAIHLEGLLGYSKKETYTHMLRLFDIGKALFDNDFEDAKEALMAMSPQEKLSLFHHLNHLHPVSINADYFSFDTTTLLKQRKMDLIRALLALAWELTHHANTPFYYTNFEIRQLFNEAGSLSA